MILALQVVSSGKAEPFFHPWIQWIARGIESAGVAMIVIGGVIATWIFLRQALGDKDFGETYRQYRAHLGRAILIGLEFLVIGDIIGTVAAEPTFQSLGVLGVVVLIRTFLSFALEVEIDGHWPWEDSKYREAGSSNPKL